MRQVHTLTQPVRTLHAGPAVSWRNRRRVAPPPGRIVAFPRSYRGRVAAHARSCCKARPTVSCVVSRVPCCRAPARRVASSSAVSHHRPGRVATYITTHPTPRPWARAVSCAVARVATPSAVLWHLPGRVAALYRDIASCQAPFCHDTTNCIVTRSLARLLACHDTKTVSLHNPPAASPSPLS